MTLNPARFALLLVAAILVQTAIAWIIPLRPLDAFLVLTVWICLVTSASAARISGWCVGLVQDLCSLDPLGLHAFTLGLTALLLTHLRDRINVAIPTVRAAVCFLAAWPPQLLAMLYVKYGVGHGIMSSGRLLLDSVLTAALAACVATLLTMRQRRLGRASPRGI